MVASAALVLTGCGGGDDSADDAGAETAAEDSASDPTADEGTARPGEQSTDGGFAGDTDGEPGGADGGPTIDLGQIGRDVIVEMHVTVSSDDIPRSVATVSARAAALGGGVASSNVDYGNPATGSDDLGYAVLVVKVPPGAIDDLIAGIERTGTILGIEQSAQDVTEQLVDLDVRIANARESVVHVREFMDRAEDLTDLVTLEAELTRRQTELEQLEAQQRNLSERVAFSTVTVEILPTASVPEPVDDDDSLGDALRRGWDGFTAAAFGVVYVLAVLLPFLAVALVVGLVVLLVLRRRRRRGHAAPAPAPISSASGPPLAPQPEETTPETTGGGT